MLYHIYADDIMVYISINIHVPDLTSIAKCLEETTTWLTNNNLSVNCNKTEALFITRSAIFNLPSRIYIQDKSIKVKEEVRYLGITLDSKLNLHSHINKTPTKAYYKLKLIRRLKPILNQDHF